MMKINSIYRKTLFNHRRALIFWGLGIILIGLFYASMYPAIGGNKQFSKAFGQAPDGVKAFIVSGDFFSTPDGFIHAEFFALTMPLIMCILAITIGSKLLATEEESGTMELLLARPVTRRKILTSKLLGMITVLTILSACIWSGLFIGSLLVSKFTITLPLMAVCVANLGLLALAFGCLALAVTSLLRSRGLSAAVAGIYFLFSYIVGTFSAQVNWLKGLEPLSIFHYFDTVDTLQHHVHPWDFVVLLGIIAVACVAAILAFSRRDTGN